MVLMLRLLWSCLVMVRVKSSPSLTVAAGQRLTQGHPGVSGIFSSQCIAVTLFSLGCGSDRITPQSVAAGGPAHAAKIVSELR